MIVTNGDLRRRFVYDVKLSGSNLIDLDGGGRQREVYQVEKLMYNGHQIWPDKMQMIATLVLDPEGLKGTRDYAIWKTVRELALMAEKEPWLRYMYIVDEVDGYGYDIDIHNKVAPHPDLCRYRYQADGADWLDFFYSDVKPGVGTVKAGDTLKLCACFVGFDAESKEYCFNQGEGKRVWSMRAGGRERAFSFEGFERFNFPMFGIDNFIGYTQQADWMLPPWEGLSFRAVINKPRKNVKMHGRWTVTSVPDGAVVASYESNIGGDKRATCVADKGVTYVAGATGMHVLGEQLRDGTNMWAWLEVMPVVDVTFKVKVKEVVNCSVYVE